MLSYVCDRCRKIMSKDDHSDSIRLVIKKNRPDKDRDIDLCPGCTKLFNTFMLDDPSDDNDEPVAMPLDEDWFKCPRCHAHYAFNVTDEAITSDFDARIQIRRIHVLRRTPERKLTNNIIEDGYINQPFVNFHCSMCDQLLKIPENILKEVNK